MFEATMMINHELLSKIQNSKLELKKEKDIQYFSIEFLKFPKNEKQDLLLCQDTRNICRHKRHSMICISSFNHKRRD